LIINARTGDNNAFKELKDIGQETFIQLYKSLSKFRGESSLGTYLTRIAINLSINEIRRRKRKRRFFFSKADNKIENIPNTKNTNDQNEIKKIVRIGIQKLEQKFRSVIVLRLIDGYSTHETAQILNLPVGTVLSRLARAQMKLKEILRPLYRG